jgi:myo-inositol-1(or 4)-monophosphatase
MAMNAPISNKHFAEEPRRVSPTRDRQGDASLQLTHHDVIVTGMTAAVRAAGTLALGYFRPGQKTTATVQKKPDGSPVTEADLAVNQLLEERLRAILPEAGWLSEESADALGRLERDLVFVVDPIDGTRSFATGDPVWAVSVALVQENRPIVGIVHAPALDETYVAVKNAGARLNGRPVKVSARRQFGAQATVGGPYGFAQRLRKAGLEFELLPRIPSLAIRVVRVASGAIDVALVSANAQDWDIAASDLILSEAGGRLINLRGRAPLYNRTHTLHGELVAGAEPMLAQLLAVAGLATTP